MKLPGKFIISLDFELFWGMRDHKTIEDYGENIIGVWELMPKMLDLFDKYEIGATFATVGFLFSSNKKELFEFVPERQPQYEETVLSPYTGHLNTIGKDEADDKYHYASSLISQIRQHPRHEISTHTFSHYYCISEGQTVTDFNEDIKAAIAIADHKGIPIKTIVFPRNMFNRQYLKVCQDNGLVAYRGNEKAWYYHGKTGTGRLGLISRRILRILNTYFNVSGHHCYTHDEIACEKPYNMPSSRFLRPYSSKLEWLEGLRKKRILNSMTHAAKNGQVFHLWWHPHNFGTEQEENLQLLEEILQHYAELRAQFGFENSTMAGYAEELEKTYG